MFAISLYESVYIHVCASWSPAGKGLTSWLSFVVSNCEFVTFPVGILGRRLSDLEILAVLKQTRKK